MRVASCSCAAEDKTFGQHHALECAMYGSAAADKRRWEALCGKCGATGLALMDDDTLRVILPDGWWLEDGLYRCGKHPKLASIAECGGAGHGVTPDKLAPPPRAPPSRDELAAMAMQGLCAAESDLRGMSMREDYSDRVAEAAHDIADAMLTERRSRGSDSP